MKAIKRFTSHFKGEELIQVALDDTDRTFSIQRHLLEDASEYFQRALNGNFQESKTRTLRLPDCDTEILETFIFWLYKRELPDFTEEVDALPYATEEKKNAITKAQLQLVRLWTFADEYLMPKLQNAAMARLLDLLPDAYARTETIILAFNSTTDTSPLRQAVVLSFLRSQHSTKDLNAYGEKKHDADAMNALGATPGFFSACLAGIHASKCGKLERSKSCYTTKKSAYPDFMVPEKNEGQNPAEQ